MTADSRRPNTWSGAAPRMRDVSHAHRDHDPRAWHWFARGPVLAADGGERSDAGRRDADERRDREDRDVEDERRDRRDRDVEDERLRDVSHQPAHGEGANRVWERGDDEDEGE